MTTEAKTVCPQCGSEDVAFSKKRQVFLCAECEHTFAPTTGVRARRIFLSYGHDEFTPLAERVRDDLRARGHEVWFDAERLKGGADWERGIDDGLARTDEVPGQGRVVLLLTPHSVRRPDGYCLNELSRALSRAMTVVPVMVSWCEPPLSICRLQWLDLRDAADPTARAERYAARFESLLDALENDRVQSEGVQSRLLSALQPLPFDVDVAVHLTRFTGRRWFFDEVDRWLADPSASRIFLATGRPGLGKTAIAAWLCANRREVGAFHLCRHGDVQKADPRWCVRSIAYQLASQLPEYQQRLNALGLERLIEECNARTLFDRLVVQPLHGGFPAPDRTMVVLIDGLDEATLDGNNELAAFLATEFVKTPVWLRLVLLTRPDPEVMHPLQGVTPRPLDADASHNDADLAAYVARELAPFASEGQLAPAVVDAMVARSEGLFLYVDRVREELAQGRLSLDDVGAFPRGLGGMYAQFFKRQFADLAAYERDVRPALELVAAAHGALPTEVLAAALGWDEYAAPRLRRALGSLFVTSDGAVRPFHATVAEWLTDENRAGPYFVSARRGHQRLADVALAELRAGLAAMSAYGRDHLADHLVSLRRADELAGLLAREDFVSWHLAADPYRPRSWWAWLERTDAARANELCRAVVTAPPPTAAGCDALADLLNALGHWSDALALYDHAIARAEAQGDRAKMANSLVDQAQILRARGDAAGAVARLDRAEPLCFETGDRAELRRCRALRSDLAGSGGDHVASLELLEQVERMSREEGDAEGLTAALLGRAWIVFSTGGNADAALALLDEAERSCRHRGAHESLARALSITGRVEAARDRYEAAGRRYAEMETICREYGMGRQLAICHNDQGELARKQGRWEEAAAAYEKTEVLAVKLGSPLMAAIAQGNRSSALAGMGRAEEALELLARSIAAVRVAGNPFTLVQGLMQQAELLDTKLARRAEALACAEEALALATEKRFGALETACRALVERLR